MIEKLKAKILNIYSVRLLIYLTKKYSFIGLDSASIYFVARFFITSISRGDLNNRAASIAFSFFLAIFPGIIFLFSLIPIIPIDNFQETLMTQITQVLPRGVSEVALETIDDLINTPRGGILSLNFVLALYFATNGIYSLMDQFNNTYLFQEKRNFIKQRLISLGLVIISTVLLIVSIFLISFSSDFLNYALEKNFINEGVENVLFVVGKYFVSFCLFYFTIAFIYYLGPARKDRWKFFSAGTSVATVSLIVTSLAFGYYVSNLSQYNKIYGSIGTIMIVMLWFHLNSFIMLVGFELNAAISKAKIEGKIVSSKKYSKK